MAWRVTDKCPEAKPGYVQGSAGGCSVLTHPLEPLVPLQAEEGGCDVVAMQGERIVWSSRELPYIATYNQVSLPIKPLSLSDLLLFTRSPSWPMRQHAKSSVAIIR